MAPHPDPRNDRLQPVPDGLVTAPRSTKPRRRTHSHRPGPEHPCRDQVLTSQPEQQRRRVVLQRPSQQELVQLLKLHRRWQPPPQILRHQPQMLGPGLRPPPVGAQLVRVHTELVSQPGHRHQRRRRHLVRNEPQPRQRAQRDRQTEPVSRSTPAAGIDERHIRRGQSEEPEQLVLADLREPPKTIQLFIREHLRSQERPPTSHKFPAQKPTPAISARFSASTTATPAL
jgi:hypothetical protein